MKSKAIFTLFATVVIFSLFSLSVCASDYEYHTEGGSPDIGTCLLISAAVGLLAAGITVFILYRQLKSVRAQKNASSYIVHGSFNLSMRQDIFLYSTVTKTPKPKNNNNGKRN